jgi:hypothetical protein
MKGSSSSSTILCVCAFHNERTSKDKAASKREGEEERGNKITNWKSRQKVYPKHKIKLALILSS